MSLLVGHTVHIHLSFCTKNGIFWREEKNDYSCRGQSCETTTVAVKMVKEGHTDHDILDLVKEMEIMKVRSSDN